MFPKRLWSGGVVAASLLALPLPAIWAGEPLHLTLRASTTRLTTWQRAELPLIVAGGAAPYSNPFDPAVVTVDVVAEGPAKRALRIPAFWSDRGANGKGWYVRVSLPQPGAWKLTALAQDSTGTARSQPVTVSVAKPNSHGFIQRSTGRGKQRYFQYSDGAPYFLVGENVCWADGKRGLADYERYFGALGKVGANYARVWMAPKAIENKESGIGRYDQENAAYFDKVLEIAEKNGIGVMLAFGTYGELNTGGYFNEGRWPVHPYNAANGGPVPADKSDAIFTNTEARRYYRQRLRYLIARYGAFRSLAFWEFWNERGGPRDWFAEMSEYLATKDPYHHLITNSYSTVGPPEIWELPAMDLTQTHRYGDEGSLPDIANDVPGDNRAHDRYKKPHLLGEFGISWRGPDAKFDPNGIGTNLHNGLWASMASGAAGGGAIWWWDNYVDPKNVYHAFTGMAAFARTVDWPNRDFEPLPPEKAVAITVPSAGPVTLKDGVLLPSGEWGVKATGVLRPLPDGTVAGGPLPRFLYGPAKADLRAPVRLRVRMAHAGTVTIKVARVSDKANLRLTVGTGTPTEIPFDASEKGPGGYKTTKFYPEYGIYQADFDKDIPVSLPAGESLLTLENTTGDWMTLASITVPELVPSDRAAVRSFGIQDTRGETILWLQDAASNWQNDRDQRPLKSWAGLNVTLPMASGGTWRADWWDTRTGKVLKTATAPATSGKIRLPVPTFTRDIALHLQPTSKSKTK